MDEQAIRQDERREVCREEGHRWVKTTTWEELARRVETETCGRCGASATTTRQETAA